MQIKLSLEINDKSHVKETCRSQELLHRLEQCSRHFTTAADQLGSELKNQVSRTKAKQSYAVEKRSEIHTIANKV